MRVAYHFEARGAFSNLLANYFYINLSIIWAVLILQYNYCLHMIKLHQLQFILFCICISLWHLLWNCQCQLILCASICSLQIKSILSSVLLRAK